MGIRRGRFGHHLRHRNHGVGQHGMTQRFEHGVPGVTIQHVDAAELRRCRVTGAARPGPAGEVAHLNAEGHHRPGP